jgi:Tol biopolymer transport system component
LAPFALRRIAWTFVALSLITAPTWAVDGGLIAFVTQRDGNGEIYTMAPDGSEQTSITHNAGEDTDPVWSPDGERIAFISNRSGAPDIYTMDADGANVERLTNDGASENHVRWAPDGSKIAFLDGPPNRHNPSVITVIDLGSGLRHTVTPAVGFSWSPDGTRFAYATRRTDLLPPVDGVVMIDADGDNLLTLSERTLGINIGGYRHTTPIWTPDGGRVLYSLNLTRSLERLISVETTSATPDGVLRAHPTWGSPVSISADGRFVASVTLYRDPLYGSTLEVHATDGSASHVLGQVWYDFVVSWAPDGSALVRTEDGDIYIHSSDGQLRERLTVEGGRTPAWQPTAREPLAAFPTLKVVSPGEDEELPASATSHELLIRMADHSGAWQWRLDSPFPAAGPGGGTTVAGGLSATITGLQAGRHHAIYIAPVTPTGELLQPAFVAVGRFRVAYPDPSPDLSDSYIAFEGEDGLFAVRPDGDDMRRLTTTDGYRDTHPTWSPDGARIAFASDREGQMDIYVLARGNVGPTRMTTHASNDFDPAWSPDGTRIAFTSARDGHDEVYLIDVADGSVARLTRTEHGAEEADWAPDGSSIAVSYGPEGWHRANLGLVDPATGGITDLGAVGDVGRPAWNPLGAPILYARDITYPGSFAYTMNPDGAEQTSLGRSLPPRYLDWSPDGAMVVFYGDGGLVLSRPNGEQKTPIDGVNAEYATPAWSPVGAVPPDGAELVTSVDDPVEIADGVTLSAGLTTLTLSSTLTDLAVDGLSLSDGPSSVMVSDLIRAGATLCLQLSGTATVGVVGESGRVIGGSDFALVGPGEYVVNFPRPVTLAATGSALHAPTRGGESMGGASEAWAFVVIPRVRDGSHVPLGARVRVAGPGGLATTLDVADEIQRVVAWVGTPRNPVVRVGTPIRVALETTGGYRLGDATTTRVTADDLRRAFAIVDIETRADATRLLPNYPNPFNPETWIPFELREASEVSITVYDARGSVVRTLHLGARLSGFHVGRADAAYWDGRNYLGEPVSSGVYAYELRAGTHRTTRRLVVAR